MEIDMDSDEKFHYKGKFFEKEEDFWAYVKEWPLLKTDHETFLREWEILGKTIWVNIEQRKPIMRNFEFNQILDNSLWEMLKKILRITKAKEL